MTSADHLVSGHFTIEPLAEGVYAAVATPRKGVVVNAAIVDLGDRTLVFDTLATLPAARDLRKAAERLTGRAPVVVVNSHWHGDHVYGNQVFLPEATIVATETTRAIMAERIAAGIATERTRIGEQVVTLERQLAEVADDRRHRLALDLAFARERAASLPEQRACLPTETFDGKMVFHGSGRRAELLTYGGGHTRSDAFLYLPDDGLALMGDLAFVRFHPLLAHGDPRVWRRIVERVRLLDLRAVLAGHGPVGTVEDLDSLARYLTTIEDLALSVVENGGRPEQAHTLSMPAPFDTWDAPEIFASNMTFLLDYLEKEKRREGGVPRE